MINLGLLISQNMKLLQTIKMVLWGFLGVRKRAGLETDAKTVHPAQVIGVLLVMAAVFIGVLLLAVSAALKSLA